MYLREAFGPLWGFLYGWTLFLVIQTGTIAAVAVAFAKYAGVFFPWISDRRYLVGAGQLGLTTQQLLAIAMIVFLTWSNTRGIRTGAAVQNVFTFAKIGALVGLVGLGFLVGRNPRGGDRQLHRLLAQRGMELRDRAADGRGHGGRAVLLRRVEQRDLHRRRGAQPAAQPAALAGAGRGGGFGAVHRLESSCT